ncbi:polysaccharide deacetylase family protein [Streptomyces sp. JH14]|uniref:polysaccharide deacetylase family protein n=1 Tax=Streptomyces sp. JH14 TaxID=2793630 RepID=UPI0023FA3AAB|nr:polysaccharide deacetylase family protein [Streptomyces sp. JH14]MDF6045604.1 polysaccharide deacetylase family protein [Streptomyces sp. JH14]
MGAVLGAALIGCGADAPSKSVGTHAARHMEPSHRPPSPSPSPSAKAAPPAQEERKPAAAAPGPPGLTPVFKRARDTTDKVVALTFDADMTADEGPRAAAGEHFDNPELIALLRLLKVHTTVFMTGRWADQYPSQARSIGTDPLFEVANHSYSHYAFTPRCYGLPVVGKAGMRAEVERADASIRRTGALNVVPYFRFPGGCYDDAALRTLAAEKMTAVQWDVVSGDAFATDADVVAKQVLDGVKPGSLVVMHCTRSAAPVTADAVRQVVPELRERGYRFVKVSDLVGEKRPSVEADGAGSDESP